MGPRAVTIVVKGRVSPALMLALDGFEADHSPGITTLHGDVPDQARLMGVLELLDSLKIEIVSVDGAAPTGAAAGSDGEA